MSQTRDDECVFQAPSNSYDAQVHDVLYLHRSKNIYLNTSSTYAIMHG